MLRMKFISNLLNAIKLSILIIILLWSFTWNSNYDETQFSSDYSKFRSSKISENGKFSSKNTLYKDFIPRKSSSLLRHKSEKSSKAAIVTDGFIPPFDEWKEIEKVKYEQKYKIDPHFHHQKVSGKRKLNYASSKCGAKILASNPEAKHKMAILNEKPDEYMMNPCRVRTWFIIELCDTVEATQIEIVNYELYSSSPRKFSLFWSEIYPTTEWRLLGTFEAKDQRTMQTFNLELKNLGKFIKMIIYSHYGKEYFCLLSVIRVIGYSMVEKFEDLHKSNESPDHNDNLPGTNFVRNLRKENKTVMKKAIKDPDIGYSDISLVKMCSLYSSACKHYHGVNSKIIYLNERKCRFFSTVYKNFSYICESNFCIAHAPFNSDSKCDQTTNKDKYFNDKFTKRHELDKTIIIPPHTCALKSEPKQGTVPKIKNFDLKNSGKRLKGDSVKLNSNKNGNMTKTRQVDAVKKSYKKPASIENELKCTCDAKILESKIKDASSKENTFEGTEILFSDVGSDVDSAGLIQKESVLYKLTTRIKASEIDLNLINKYLQQLSQSYRQQMQDLQAMFNETVKAINVATEMSIKIERKQQESINKLQQKVTSLTGRVEYLMSGHHNMIYRVVEMHVFFIILEIIIISTIFTVFLNIFNRKKTFSETQPDIKYL